MLSPLLLLLLLAGPTRAERCKPAWRLLQAGVSYAKVPVDCGGKPAAVVKVRDDRLHLVRVEPGKVKLRALIASQLKSSTLSAGQWAKKHRLALVINLGMYLNDHRTHVGYLRSGDHVDSRRWVKGYQSLLVLGPRAKGLPTAAMLDLEDPGAREQGARYDTVVQNLRLIRLQKQGKGVWSSQPRRWSEAALAIDDRGRLLFLFARAPLTMWELNRLLLALPLGIVRAMHLEGGPEASLSIHAGGVELDLCGSFETGFVADDSNASQWPLPNVLGVERR